MSTKPRLRLSPLALFLIPSIVAAAILIIAQITASAWWSELRQPPWTLPPSLLGTGWIASHFAMAVAAWRVWQRTDDLGAQRTFRWFRSQIALAAFWGILLFGLRRADWALFDLIVLWTTMLMMLLWSWRVDRIAGGIWAACLGWTSYAAALTAAVWNMNR
jgi:translocator protein